MTTRAAYRPSIPPINGRLSQVVRRLYVSDGGGGGDMVDTQIWSGTAPVYATNKVEVGFNTAGAAILNEADSVVVVPSTLPGTVAVELETGDRLTYVRPTSGTATRRIIAVEDRTDFGFVRCFAREDD